MIKLFCLALLGLLCVSCATSTYQTDALIKRRGDLPKQTKLGRVPFIKQKKNHCGPATMAMVMKYQGQEINLSELTSQMYTSGMKGTFQTEMVSVARRQGMMAIPVSHLEHVLAEVTAGNPVIVFQNLGLSFYPKWHYAVVTGFDLKGPDIILHTGGERFKKSDMRFFERSWKLGGSWGLLILRPDQLSPTASELTHVQSAAALEQAGKLNEAEIAYQSILTRWPHSLTALIGMGNITYARKDFKKSAMYLERAAIHHPRSPVVWHNLATAQKALGRQFKAKESSRKALSLADDHLKDKLKSALRN